MLSILMTLVRSVAQKANAYQYSTLRSGVKNFQKTRDGLLIPSLNLGALSQYTHSICCPYSATVPVRAPMTGHRGNGPKRRAHKRAEAPEVAPPDPEWAS